MEKLLEDTEHWQNLAPPLAPNADEVEIYRELVRDRGPICLLGMTKELIHLCEYMVDLNPIPQKKPVIRSEWGSFREIADAVMGDGVLNLSGMDLVPKLLERCELLVCRVFLKKFEGMKYATHFPDRFPGSSEMIMTQPDIAIVVWRS